MDGNPDGYISEEEHLAAEAKYELWRAFEAGFDIGRGDPCCYLNDRDEFERWLLNKKANQEVRKDDD